METSDTESTLQEYEIQLEQVEIALKSDPSNEELLKLKQDLIVTNQSIHFFTSFFLSFMELIFRK